MDEHKVTLEFVDGSRWVCTTNDKSIAESTFRNWGSMHGFGIPKWMSHTVSTMNSTSRVEYCERSFDWETGTTSGNAV